MKKKSQSRRSRVKYPALDKNLNIKSRRHCIEADYINGVYDENGKEVIRPCTEEEKAWLNKYYEETIVTTFKQDGTDLYPNIEQRRALYRENNHRNSDLFNFTQKTGNLKYIENERYDDYFFKQISHLDFELSIIGKLEKLDHELCLEICPQCNTNLSEKIIKKSGKVSFKCPECAWIGTFDNL